MKGLYSETRISGDVFIKTYDESIPSELVKKEFYKSEKIYDLEKNGLFKFPKPLSQNNRTIISESLGKEYIDLEEFLYRNNSFRHQNLNAAINVMKRCGTILGSIHTKLKLEEKEILGWNIAPHIKAFLYTDFGLKSVLIKDEEITLIDPSFNLITNKVCLYDSVYYDLAYFIFNLTYLIPLKHRFTYLFDNTELLIREFLMSYELATGFAISKPLLERYDDEIKNKYLKTLKNTWKEKIWRKIINEPNEFYKGSQIVPDYQGAPYQCD